MQEITLLQLMAKAKSLHKNGRKWHFHMLPPGCIFNKAKRKHALVLEEKGVQQPFVFYSHKKCDKQGKILVKMLHGAKILGEKSIGGKNSNKLAPMLKRAEQFSLQGKEWHHHMLFPGCIYNMRKGKWCILFEAARERTRVFFSSEPRESLRRIELLFYAQKA